MNEGSAEGYRGGVLDFEMEMGGRGKYPIMCRCISNCVPYYFSDFDAAGLMHEEHFVCYIWVPRRAV